MYLDWTYLLLIPPMILAFYASAKVRSTFEKYSQVAAASGATGAQVARGILDANGLADVKVERIEGNLTDHFDPRTNVLRLSEPVYGSRSLAALGVAAHEAGHALQHARGYVPLKARQGIWPVAAFGSNLGPILAIIGIILMQFTSGHYGLLVAEIGIGIFSIATVFTIITLPVEINASRRALVVLVDGGYVTPAERGDAKKVLDAAALTYIAAAFKSVMMLLQFILMFMGARRR